MNILGSPEGKQKDLRGDDDGYEYNYFSFGHNWIEPEQKIYGYCYECLKQIGGYFDEKHLQCQICGINVHQACIEKLSKRCKLVAKLNYHKNINDNLNQNNGFRHQFFDNVQSDNLFCSHCQDLCQETQYSVCMWCQKVYHLQCIESNQIHKQSCDLIINIQKCILKPDDVQFDQMKNQFIINQQLLNDKSPIIAIINSKSGAQQGAQAISVLYKLLNPIQVIDLCPQQSQGKTNLENRLKIFENCKNTKIIVGGGDGTISSVVNQVRQIEMWSIKNPPIAILPLGTGNDLSIALDWGRKCQTNYQDMLQTLKQVQTGKPILFDRWKVNIDGHQKIMFNYCSIGLDAQLCLEFHQYRERYPNLFKSRFVNKFVYGQCGATNLFINGPAPNLREYIIFKCDNEILELPDLQNLIFLNIPNCHGGVKNLWKVHQQQQQQQQHQQQNEGSNIFQHNKLCQFKNQSMSDCQLEVIGVQSILHLGQIQVQLDSPLQINQGRKFDIIINEGVQQFAMQVDGEPFLVDPPLKVEIQHMDQVYMLSNSESEGKVWESKILSSLEQAELDKIITNDQKKQLLERLLQHQ